MEQIEWIVDDATAGSRLDVALAERLPDVTRSQIRRWTEEGRVTLDGAPTRAAAKLKPGARVAVTPPAPQDGPPQPEPMNLRIAHEDDALVIVDKPAGLVTHPAPGAERGTLVNGLLARYPEMAAVGDPTRPGIAHRLDKNTSGLLAAARTPEALDALKAQLADHSMRREYLAVALVGEIEIPSTGAIVGAIGRSESDRKKMAVTRGGKPATTHYTILARRDGLAALRLRLETGRTHQIRVHLAHRGWPVVGDPEYGPKHKALMAAIPKTNEPLRSRAAKLTRQMLHAAALRLRHPATGAEVEFEAPPPDDLAELIAALR